MADLLLELFSEEIPAGMQPKAESWLRNNITKALKTAKLDFAELQSFRTPRRLAIIVKGLPEQQPDVSEERKGPATTAPDQALEGFLRSTGLSKEQLETREIKGKDYFFAVMNQKGKSAVEALKPLIESLLQELPWQKSMRWGAYELSWARPLQNICCILDDAIIPIEFAHLTANNLTYGHRFHAPVAIEISTPNDYEAALEKAHVIADGTKREALIKQGLLDAASKSGTTLLEDSALLLEVTGLVEWPVILTGKIDKAFMELPPEVMRSEMRNHQKYFTLLNKDGSAAKQFLITSNIEASDGGAAVIAGNERVLRARLADGQFFYDKDRTTPLEKWNEKLAHVTFHAKLGSIADKVERIEKISHKLSQQTSEADTAHTRLAASLCKADLVTGMVGEFPELQGTMGYYYAKDAAGEEVSIAIRDHYLPQGPHSKLPANMTGCIISMADKLDSLISLFSIDELPTGSKDPFALRRAALGIIRILLEKEISLPLKPIILAQSNQELCDKLWPFISERLRGVLKDKGMRYDVIEAVLSNDMDDDILRLSRKVEALQHFMQSNDANALMTAYGRAANILAKNNETQANKISTDLLEQLEEKNLYAAMQSTSSAVQAHLAAEAFGEALTSFAELRQPVDAFFDKVIVNADNEDLRNNRLSLLSELVENMQKIADFSQIQEHAA